MILNWTRHSVTCALACAAMLLGSGTLHAEGSRSMFPSGIAGARAPMDLTNNATYAGVARNRQFIYVYAEANEYILVGSRNRGSNGDVFIYNPQSFGTPANETIPGTANFTCSTTNTGPAAFGGGTRGTISSRANELAGPNSANNAVTVTNGWSPCAYRAPSTGIYGVRFTGASSGGLSVQAADTGTLQVLASQVSAWEVAVRANVASTTDLNGRVFTYAWIGRTGGNGVNARVFHSLYYVTQDGYRYEQTMKGLDPFAYALYGNAQGFTDNGDPLYKSVRGDNQTASVIQPAGTGITAQAAQYPIFFSTLSPSAPHAAQINATLTALSIPTTPPVPQLLSASFAGDVGGVVSTQNVGGTFTFETVNTLSYQIVISRDGVNFDPANTLNRVLYGTANTGTHMEVWDGLDNGGLPFPVGSFPFRVSGRNGEVHFPIIDTEGMALGGPRVAQLNGSLSTTVYYDDRGYVTSNGTLVGELNGHICGAGNAQVEPSPRQALAGVDSSTTYRSYPQVTNDPNTDCVSNPATHFGTAKALDTWALERTVDISDTLVVVLADMSATFGAIPPVFSPGQTVTGLTLTCANGGPSDAVNATCVPTVSAGSISGLSCTPSSPAASLANGASMVCTFNFTAPGTAGGTDTAATGITFTGTAGAANDSVTGNNVVTVATTVIDAVNDDFTGAPIGGVAGGVTASVFANDTLGVATVTAGAVTPSITNNGGLTGASINANGTINVPAGSAGGTYAVTYQICTLTPPTPAVCDTAVASVLVIAPRLSMTKTASASPWTVGVPASYTLSVQNTGTQATTAGAAITDSIPAGLSIGALPGGCSAASQVVTCTIASGLAVSGTASFVIPVTPTAAAQPSVTNSATASGGGDPTCPAAARCTSSVGPTTVNAPQLTITKTASASPWTVGVAASYALSVQNTGTTATTAGATISDTIPAGLTIGALPGGCSAALQVVTCSIGSGLAVSGTATFVIPVTPTAAAQPSVTNTATVSGGGDPGCPAAARCMSTVGPTAVNAPQLTITKTASASPWTVGVAASYTLSVQNTGTAATTAAATISDTIPAGLTIGTLPGGCVAAVQTVTCTITSGLAVSATTSFIIPVTPTSAAQPSVTNTATVSGGGDAGCPVEARCTSTVGPTTVNAPLLTLTKTASAASFTIGVPASYTLSVQNTGTTATTAAATISDTIPTGLAIGTLPGGCGAAGQTVTCTVGSGLAVSGTSSFVIPVTATVAATSPAVNSATVSGGGDPGCPAAARCTSTTNTPLVDAVIDAVADDFSASPINGFAGGSTASVLVNDTLNGAAVNPADIVLTPGAAPVTAAGSITMNADGTITVAAGTTAGTYTYPYTICEVLNPANCDSAVATVVVAAATIDAVDDDYSATPINGFAGGTTATVLANDTLNGAAVNPADIALTPGAAPVTAAGSITMNADGTITVAAGTTAGTYTYPYTICEVLNPANCDSAVATVVVAAATIDAVDDDYSATPINGFAGGTTATVLANDTLNGAAVNPADIVLTPGAAPVTAAGSITMNADGTITVAAGTTAGTYTYPYTICEVLNPANCDSAVATIVVAAATIDAVDDDYSATPINGFAGGSTASVLVNDTLNGAAVNPADIALTPGAAPVTAAGAITMNADGTITVAAGTTAGTYLYPYTICEALNPANCDSAVATVVVAAATIDAVDDDYSATPINGFAGGSTASVLVNDTLNGAPVVPGDITLTPGAAPVTAAGSITMNADGTITVAAGTTAGTYTYSYTICEVLNPANCDSAIATVVVAAATIDAVDDDYSATPINGFAGGTTATVLANDTLNGAPVVPGDITLTPGAAPVTAAGSITMNADGTITVAAGTTAGTYTYPYTICSVLNPANCDSAIATVVVAAATIDAVDDDYSATPINGFAGGTTATVLANDTLNGAAVNPADIVLTPGAAPVTAAGSITMNADGTITVAAGTTAGTYTYPYTICEVLNPANCDSAVATVVVAAATIDAVDDDYSATPINGFAGGSTASVLVNDTLNGAAVNPADIVLTPGAAPVTAAGSITMNADGTITVAAGTTAGTYTYSYTICSALNPANCDSAIATVVVAAATIDAVDDDYSATPINGFAGGSTASVLVNDTLNGAPVVPGDITLTPGAAPVTTAGSITMNADGTITVAAGTTAGTYTYPYTICEVLNPANCDSAVATVVVAAATIDAVDDDYSATPINGFAGGTTATVLANDTLNGAAVNPADIALTPGAAPVTAAGSITMNADGTITVAPGTTAGTYTYPYTICEVLNPANCDSAIATVVVAAATIDAVDDDNSATPINGFAGGSTASVLVNDTLNGAAVNPADIVLTPGAAPVTAAGSITMNADGTITVAAGTTAGTYTYPYTICEVLNPANCDSAVATVVVAAATIDAVDDDYSATPINGFAGGSTASVLVNDTLNGAAVNPADIVLTPGAAPVTAAGSITMNADGTITVAAGTAAGTYLYPYTICEVLNPANCDSAVATVVVVTIDAIDDGTFLVAATGGTTPTVVGNDLANGAPVAIGVNATLTPGASPDPNLVMNPDGTISVAPGTLGGTYLYPYTICLLPPNATVCDSAVATVEVEAAPSLTVAKSAGAPSGNTAGSTISYSFLVTNTGNVTLTGIVINDAQLDAAASCPLTTLNPGETTTCTGVHTITQAEVNAGTSDNTATASGTPPVGAPVTSPPSTTNTPIAAAPSLTVVKSAGAPSGNTAGSTISYSFLVTNTGNVTLTGIVINDAQLDAAASCPLTTLNPGETTTCTGVHTITQTEVNAGTSDNTATASGTPPVGAPVTSPPSTTNTPIAAAPSLTVVKSAGAPSGNTAGSTIAYSFLVTNTGNVTLTGIVVNDAQLDAAAACSLTTLNPGETTTCAGVHTITQTEVNAGTSDNTATASGTPPVGAPVTSPPSTTNTPIAAAPSLTVVKSAGAPSGNTAGSTIAYSFLVTNTGNVTLTGIVINDAQLDAAASCPLTTLNPGETTTCTGVHTITQTEVNAGTSDNTATASGTPPVGAPVTSPPSTTNTPIAAAPSLTVVKSAGAATTNLGASTTVTDAGDTIAYSFLVTNTGNVTLTAIVINDAQLDAPATCPLTTLNPGETTTCTGVHTITQAEVNAGTSDNTATASGTPPVGAPVTSPPSTTNTPIASNPALTVDKTAGTPTTNLGANTTVTDAGDTIDYSFLVTNTGNVTLTGIVINDAQLDAPATCPLTTLNPGESTTCTGVHTITLAEVNAGTSDNTATASGTPPVGAPVTSPPSTANTPIASEPALTVEKSAGTPTTNLGSSTTVTDAGDTIDYSFLVTNTGNVTLTGIVINDAQLDAPATCPLTTLNPGETTTCTGVHTITLAEVNAGGVDNTATATGSPPSGDPVTSPPSTVNTPVSATASIELVKTADAPTLPTVGSDIQYTFVATNTGNVTLNNVTITDPLPGLSALSCTPVQPATLDPGQALSCTATYTVTTADLNAGGVDNTASVSGTPPSGPAATDDDTVSTPATPVLDVSKVLTAESLNTDGAAQPGEQLTYTITVTNQAGVPATDVIVVEQVPGNTTFVSGAPTWSCAPGSVGGTTCETLVNVPAFSAGNPGTVTATFVVQVADPLDDVVQSIANVVTLDGEPPADCVVMPDAPQCVVLPTLNLHLEKSVVGVNPTGPGSFNVVYQLLVRNAGSAEGSYTLFDTLDFTTSGVSFFADALVTTADGSINAALVGGRFTPANGATVQVSAADVAIPGGSSHTYVLTVPIAVNNDALANGECTGGPGNGLFNAADVDGPMTLASTACAPIGGSGDAAIRLLKTVQLAVDFNNNGYGDVGDVLNYSLVISNRGSQPLTNLALLDWQVTDLACEAQTASGAPITVLINNQIFRSSFEVLGGAGLLPNDSVQCWATHTITAGDVAARRVTNVATAKGQGAAGQTVTATSTAIYSAFP